jgi:excisionase family DNA binding protein
MGNETGGNSSVSERLLYDRKSAAQQLSISMRALDRLVANKCLNTRRIGSRVLIPYGELKKFARADHFTMACN